MTTMDTLVDVMKVLVEQPMWEPEWMATWVGYSKATDEEGAALAAFAPDGEPVLVYSIDSFDEKQAEEFLTLAKIAWAQWTKESESHE